MIPGGVFVRGWNGGEGGKGEGDNGEGEALLVLRWLLSLPRQSSPLSPSFNYKSKNRYSRERKKGRGKEPKTISTLVTATSTNQNIKQTLTVLNTALQLRSKNCPMINDGEQTEAKKLYHLLG